MFCIMVSGILNSQKVEMLATIKDSRYDSHTGDWVSHTILDMMENFGVHHGAVTAMVSDSGSNLKLGFRLAELNNFLPCGCHLLHRFGSCNFFSHKIFIFFCSPGLWSPVCWRVRC